MLAQKRGMRMSVYSSLADAKTSITAGETLLVNLSFSDYPRASGDTLTYKFRGMSNFEKKCTANGTGFTLTVPDTVTDDLEPGVYAYTAFFNDASKSQIISIDSGTLEVLANPGKKTHAQTMLAAIRARLESRATNDQLTIAIDGVQLKYMEPDDLLKWEGVYLERVKREVALMSGNRGGPMRGIISTRFV